MSAIIKYKGATVAEVRAGEIGVISCAEQEMEEDIFVAVPQTEIAGEELENFIQETPETISLPNATKIKPYAFYNQSNLLNIEMPNVTSIGPVPFLDAQTWL